MKNGKNRIDLEVERYEKIGEEQPEVDQVLEQDPGLVLATEAN